MCASIVIQLKKNSSAALNICYSLAKQSSNIEENILKKNLKPHQNAGPVTYIRFVTPRGVNCLLTLETRKLQKNKI